MRLDLVKSRVEEIAAMAGDNEAAHGAEDALYIDVLKAIAGGAANARDLATEALKANDLDFTRWYA